eukprot:534920_1
MASYFKHIDDKSNKIVCGFIREVQNILLLTNSKNSYCIIPSEISLICLSYIDDHFLLNEGTFQWIIDGELLQNIKCAETGNSFQSDIFNIGELNCWRIVLAPNGLNTKSAGIFVYNLQLAALPFLWQSMVIYTMLKCMEIELKFVRVSKITKPCSLPHTISPFSSIKDLKLTKLTFTLKIKILQIILKSDNKTNINILYQHTIPISLKSTIRWKIDAQSMKNMLRMIQINMKMSNFQLFQTILISDVYDQMWCLVITSSEKTMLRLRLQLCALPKDLSKIGTNIQVQCKELNIEDELYRAFDFNKSIQRCGACHDISLKELSELKEVTICVNITILKRYDVNGKDITESVWNNFVKQNSQIVTNVNNNNICNKRLEKIESQLQVLIQHVIHNNENNMMKELTLINNQLDNILHKKTVNRFELSEKEMISLWLNKDVKLAEYFDLFVENGFDKMEYIVYITEQDLIQIGINKLGHRKHILRQIQQFKNSNNM